MSNIGEMLNAYQKKTDCTRAEIARRTGVPERRLRAIMAEGRKPIPQEEVFLTSWLKSVGFSYVPQEEASEDVPKAPPKKKVAKAEAIGIRGDARVLVQIYRETMGFKTDTDAATDLVKKGFMSILKEASNVE